MSEILRTEKRSDLDNMKNAIKAWSIGDIDHEVDIDPTPLSNGSFLLSRSTKSESCRIGAFQSRQLIRSAGDDIRMKSEKGTAATLRVITR
jgi:hypothetical protein